MSLKKSATHRLGLMAGSSLVAATLSTFAFTGAALAPTAVFAANECTPIGVSPSANAAAPDSYTCSAASYATGITYSSDGALTVTKTNTTATPNTTKMNYNYRSSESTSTIPTIDNTHTTK